MSWGAFFLRTLRKQKRPPTPRPHTPPTTPYPHPWGCGMGVWVQIMICGLSLQFLSYNNLRPDCSCPAAVKLHQSNPALPNGMCHVPNHYWHYCQFILMTPPHAYVVSCMGCSHQLILNLVCQLILELPHIKPQTHLIHHSALLS